MLVSGYMRLVSQFPLVRITNDTLAERARKILEGLARIRLDEEQKEYVDALTILLGAYSYRKPAPFSSLKVLMEGMTACGLAKDTGFPLLGSVKLLKIQDR